MNTRRGLAVLAAVVAGVLTFTACQNAPLPVPAPTTTPRECPDFTEPGAAAAMITRLTANLGSNQTVMVQVQQHELAVTALVDEAPSTWACRAGVVEEVPTDIVYVDQATFSVNAFDIDDIGSLFRAAAAIAGSSENQVLQIVDYSGGRVMMAVATNPESRTVFFNPDGSLLENLDFDTPGGIKRGLADVEGGLTAALQVTIESDKSVWIDSPGADDGTVVRRQRTQRIPVTTITRGERTTLPTFSPRLVNADVIWSVVEDHLGAYAPDTSWSVSIDDRESAGGPHMHFSFGQTSIITDLFGRPWSAA